MPIESAFPEIAALRGEAVVVLASGDPFHYGVGSLIAAHVPSAEMRVFPKPSSLSLAAARLGWALQDCTIVSLHGRPLETIIPALAPGARILALAWDGTTASRLARSSSSAGMKMRRSICWRRSTARMSRLRRCLQAPHKASRPIR